MVKGHYKDMALPEGEGPLHRRLPEKPTITCSVRATIITSCARATIITCSARASSVRATITTSSTRASSGNYFQR